MLKNAVKKGDLELVVSTTWDWPVDAVGPLVAFPKNAESDISFSFLVTRAPRTAIRNRSFCVITLGREFLESEEGGAGCCPTIRFRAKADFACV